MAEHFAKATPALLADANLTDGDVRVYLAILSHADWGALTNCFPSLQLIGDTAGKRRSVVIKNIANLIKHGWITRTPRFDSKGQTASLYGFPKQHAAAVVGAKSGRTLGAESGHDQEPVHQEPKPQRAKRRSAPLPTPSYLPRPDAADIQARDGVSEREALRRCKVYK